GGGDRPVSPPRRGKGKARAEPPPPDLVALRKRLVETMQADGKLSRGAARKGRRVLPDEGTEEGPPSGGDELDRTRGPSRARWWEQAEPSVPRPVVGGIVARTRKGPIGATWWSRRFLRSLEAVMVGGRMERGRSYARKGQVVDLRIGPGVVTATVQGSRDDPYTVHLRMPVVAGEDWDRIAAVLAARAGYAARMLAGELPHEVEQVFEAQGASLLPAPHARLVSECTCPDWENPCKHIAAVCYLLAEEFDRDPFLLLAWRGRDGHEVLDGLRALRQQGAAQPSRPDEAAAGAQRNEEEGRDDADPWERFWVAGPELAHVRICPEAAQVPGAVLRLAARGMISVRGGDVVDVLASAYREIAASAAARARS
ncbi:MAG TPA: SWIM zinc finger family protein, partial [Acidimicrobiales bacterium]|nr:SWIM zinc finger family protein [Acidimicrobiales bacterium]